MTYLRQAIHARRRKPGVMHGDAQLTDVVVFDVPSLTQARDLVSRLDTSWACHAYRESNITSVSVYLAPARYNDLAALLRTVEDWVAARKLGGIMFWLDGRGYVLQSHDPALADSLLLVRE
jgi:hypothetical protein